VLNLQIRQEFLSLIMKGEKKQEFREIRPTTEKKFIQLCIYDDSIFLI